MTEIQKYKKRADDLGIEYANNSSLDKIKKLVEEAETKEAKEADDLEEGSTGATEVVTGVVVKPTTRKEATKLSIIVITNMDPADKHKTTEEVNLSNDAFGKICHRIIPYGVEWACERAGIDYLKSAKFMRKVTKKSKEGNNIIEQIPTLKFNVIEKELTKEIVDSQKKRQSARGE